MLVVPQAESVVLSLRDPQLVLQEIPGSRLIVHEGKHQVAVPHGILEVRKLRELGINPPGPIQYYYNWSGRFTPYEHQRVTADFLTNYERCLVLNEIGTGKTQSALWAADYLMDLKVIRKVLIISPLSTLVRVWGDALFTSFPHRRFVILHGSANTRRNLLKCNYEFYIINHDGFAVVAGEPDVSKFDLVIVDEAAVYRNPTSIRHKLFRNFMATYQPRLWLMTGTPTPEAPIDAWALGKMVNNPLLAGVSYPSFKQEVMVKVGQFKWVPRPEAVSIVSKILQPSIRYTREECFDLPETVVQSREVPLTSAQSKLYKLMLKDLLVALSNGLITAANEAVKVMKLIQICLGAIYDDDHNAHEIDASPRITAVKEVIEEAGGKVIIFTPITASVDMLYNKLSSVHTCAIVDGRVGANKRNAIFKDFQGTTYPRVLIAHPKTMAHGLTLTAASTIIWYGPIDSNEVYDQANGRIERIGKKQASNVVHIYSTEVERIVYDRLINKKKMQGILLDLVQRGE